MARVTSKDIAEKAGVSRTTVSFVINGRTEFAVAPETRERVLRIAAEMGYVPSASARGLVTGRTQTLGIVSDRLSDPHYSGMLDDLLLIARGAGYHLLVVSDSSASSLLAEGRLDGAIILASVNSQALLVDPRFMRIPLVFIGCRQYMPGTMSRYTAEWDDQDGGERAARYLLSLGHRRLAVMAGNTKDSHPKVLGFLKAAKEAGISPVLLKSTSETVNYDERNIYEAGRSMFDQLFEQHRDVTAVFCRNDLIALGAISRASDLGVDVPGDLSVLGYSNVPMTAYSVPSLTTLATPIREAGRKALDLLIQILADEPVEQESISMPVHLIERKSTRRLEEAL